MPCISEGDDHWAFFIRSSLQEGFPCRLAHKAAWYESPKESGIQKIHPEPYFDLDQILRHWFPHGQNLRSEDTSNGIIRANYADGWRERARARLHCWGMQDKHFCYEYSALWGLTNWRWWIRGLRINKLIRKWIVMPERRVGRRAGSADNAKVAFFFECISLNAWLIKIKHFQDRIISFASHELRKQYMIYVESL